MRQTSARIVQVESRLYRGAQGFLLGGQQPSDSLTELRSWDRHHVVEVHNTVMIQPVDWAHRHLDRQATDSARDGRHRHPGQTPQSDLTCQHKDRSALVQPSDVDRPHRADRSVQIHGTAGSSVREVCQLGVGVWTEAQQILLGPLAPELASQRTSHQLGAATRAAFLHELIDPGNELVRQPDSDLSGHTRHGTTLGCNAARTHFRARGRRHASNVAATPHTAGESSTGLSNDGLDPVGPTGGRRAPR